MPDEFSEAWANLSIRWLTKSARRDREVDGLQQVETVYIGEP